MRLGSIFGVALAVASSLGAEDFWIARPPEQWSGREIKRMVTDSPWARQATVRTLSGAAPITDMGPPAGRSSDSAPSGAGPPAAPEILVRWESAVPVVEACSHGGMDWRLFSCASKLLYLSGLGQKFDELQKTFYIVGLSNYPMPLRRQGDAPEHSEAANAALERMSLRIQDSTFLKRKSRSPSKAARVVALPAGQSLLLIVFFPRSEALSVEDEKVLFESTGGAIELKATFNLRTMLFRGRLEL